MRRPLKIVALAILLAACAGKQPESADEYYRAATSYLQDGAYPLAIEHYRELVDQHPFSEHSEEAELNIALAHFHNRACPEAIAAFSDFQRRYPTSPHLPLVGYLIGQCHEKQMQRPNRDQSASQSAHAFYQAVMHQYPESPYADLARERLHHCRESLAQHELNIARFYQGRGNSRAEEIRLVDLVKQFNDTDQAAEALFRLGELYRSTEEPDKASLAFAALLYHHRDHNHAGDATEALRELSDGDEVPLGDPMTALLARSGRFRDLPVTREGTGDGDRAAAGAPNVGFNRPSYDDDIGTSRPNRRY